MRTKGSKRGFLLGLAGLAALSPLALRGQSGTYSSEPITLGSSGYRLNFSVLWTCDDSPSGTTSFPGEVDLVDGGGNVVAEVTAAASGSAPSVEATAGAVSNATASVHLSGANGTPADGNLHATWTITGPAPGPYTLRFWHRVANVPRISLSTITTTTQDTGGGGPLGPSPTPTPTPTPTPSPTPSPPPPAPPSVAVSAPPAATAFQLASLGATATRSAQGNPLALVEIDLSMDGGASWSRVAADAHPASSPDTLSASFAFPQAGNALVRAVATDSAGLSASATSAVSVGKAPQPAPAITPPQAALAAGQSLTFAASGGASGSYTWGGAASGAGPTAGVSFPSAGTYAVTVTDVGNANYLPSAPATATITVTPALFTLSLAATPGGLVSGGGTYPANAQATAVATAFPGNAFLGWTGDLASQSPSVSLRMTSNVSLLASFTALLSQTISFSTPSGITAHSQPFTLSAWSSSGLPVTLSLSSGPASLSGALVTPSGATGQVNVVATQPGNATYLPAPPQVISFPIGPPPPGVTLSDDSGATKRSDRTTRTTSYTSGPAHP